MIEDAGKAVDSFPLFRLEIVLLHALPPPFLVAALSERIILDPTMAMYYLAQNGAVTGPFAEGRLISMEDAGEIGLDDQLAIAGTEDWLPATDVLAPIRLEIEDREMLRQERKESKRRQMPVRRKKKRSALLIIASLIVFLIGLSFLIGSLLNLSLLGIGFSLLVILAAAAIDRPKWICEKCGNRVEKTSTQCPACGVPLTRK